MKNGNDAFESALRDSLESYEVPYNSADWAQLEKELNKSERGGWKSSAGLLALLFGGSMAVATAVYFTLDAGGKGMGDMTQVEPTTATGNEIGGASTADESALSGSEHSQNNGVSNEDKPKASGTGVEVLPIPTATNTNSGAVDVISGAAPKTSNATTASKPSASTTTAGAGLAISDERVMKPSSNNTTELAIHPSLSDGCPGNSVIFNVDNAPTEANGSQLWNFGDGSFSTDKAPSHVFTKPGRYNVTLSYSTNKGGLVQKSVADVIVVHEVPEANFTVLKQEYENTIPSVHFENRSLGGATYAWDFGDGGKSNVMIPDHVFKKAGTYQVRLEVTNRAGCSDHIEKTVVVDEDYNLLAEKAFTPNSDGREDTFMPEALKTLGVKFRMTVLNSETGQLVYETTDVQRPWNGRIAGRGEACVAGDYIWMVEMKNGEVLGGTYNGTVSLLR